MAMASGATLAPVEMYTDIPRARDGACLRCLVGGGGCHAEAVDDLALDGAGWLEVAEAAVWTLGEDREARGSGRGAQGPLLGRQHLARGGRLNHRDPVPLQN